ncbi:hypothetical protein DPMN_159143 [Dreissena polymorpha]|uniref:Uncharacterized protein n=1 Tax=Dreissena polymorpha TaxID=45954 RepID=A0A9D4EMS0_DREPO|nr:hypothetical protein DPMN_159143 [Dreissena polymorpha]
MHMLNTPIFDQSRGESVINEPKEKRLSSPLSPKQPVIGSEKNYMCNSTSSSNDDDEIDLEKDKCLSSDLDEKPKFVYKQQIRESIFREALDHMKENVYPKVEAWLQRQERIQTSLHEQKEFIEKL